MSFLDYIINKRLVQRRLKKKSSFYLSYKPSTYLFVLYSESNNIYFGLCSPTCTHSGKNVAL